MNLPDPILHYALAAKPFHATLRRSLIQLSGFLLKRLTAERNGFVDFTPVEAARAGIEEAAEGLRSLRTPVAAEHHRTHLDGAVSALERCLAVALSRSDAKGDALFSLLEEAERHLRATSRALPGFEAVDLTQACCAAHSQAERVALRCIG